MKLIALVFMIALAVLYAWFLKGLVAGGSWVWMALMFVWPVVLAWFVGDEADREDFYKIRDWLVEKLRIR